MAGRPRLIMIVGSDDRDRERRREAFSAAGMDPLFASGGIDALRLMSGAGGFMPDAIVTDMEMQRCDGLDLCREIRLTSKWREIPVLILAAWQDSPRVRQAAAIPDVVVRQKPCPAEDLVVLISEMTADELELTAESAPEVIPA